MVEYKTISEVAETTGASYTSVWNQIKKGKIKSVSFGRSVMIPTSEIKKVEIRSQGGKKISNVMKNMLTVREVSEHFNVSYDTIYNMIRRNKIMFSVVDNHFVISRKYLPEVEKLLTVK